MHNIKELVKGRWPSILNRLGINVGDGQHTDCPMCGKPGKSKPFRFDDLDGTGSWICNYCGAGDGWLLAQNVLGMSFGGVVGEISKFVSDCPESKITVEPKASPEILRKLFMESKPMQYGDLASHYLECRGLRTFPPSLRTSKSCYEMETKQNHNAMLAVFYSAAGKALTIHRTYLSPQGEAKLSIEQPRKIMPSLDKMAGGAVRLFEVKKTMGIAEGIENAIAAYEIFKIPTWACLTSTLLESFSPPPGIELLVIYGDNDKNFAGQAAAYKLANSIKIKHPEMEVDVRIPLKVGADWLDMLVDMRKREKSDQSA